MHITSKKNIVFVYDETTPSGVRKIADKVVDDIELVTGNRPSIINLSFKNDTEDDLKTDRLLGDFLSLGDLYIYFGIVGESVLLSRLSVDFSLDFSDISGKREVYGFFPSENRLIIAGSDKRGTIYGLFHISELIGVSPLVNWSNVYPQKKKDIYIDDAVFISKEPSVRYRGFFINDEWPAFGNWCMTHFGGFTAKAYEGIFELLLRMKGNYLWPAMWSSCFAEDGPGLESAILADELGVVMGLSHHEPCLRHGEEYTHVRGKDSIYGDAYDFISNKEGITRFWRDGLKRNGHLENVITLGMRGERDSKILGKDATLKDNIDLIRDVLKTQNQLIREEVNDDLTKVPRMIALYKEVEPFYYGTDEVEGLKNEPELDNVILLLCDDNHGYVRSLPTEEMRNHKGGFGMYYHFDYHGEPVSYEWINSTYLPEVWEQMTTAYEHGIRDLWIVNVGDLGLQETPLSYFLNLAYDYETYGINAPNQTKEYLKNWLELQFGSVFDSDDIERLTDAYDKYTRLVHNRRPEHMNMDAYSLDRYEAEKVLFEIKSIETVIKELKKKCPKPNRDSYTELISYNVLAGLNLIKLWIYRAYNHFFASIGALAANDYGKKIKDSLEKDRTLAEKFKCAADGKWAGFEMAEHIGFKNWNSEESARPVIETVVPVNGSKLIAGLTSEAIATSGLDWTKKLLTVNEWRRPFDDINDIYEKESKDSKDANQIFETRIFVAATGDTEVSYDVILNEGDSADSEIIVGENIFIDKSSGTVGPEKTLDYITVRATRKVLEKLSAEDNVHVYITPPEGKIDILLCGFRKDRVEIAAEDYVNKKSKGFVTLKDIGSWDSGVKMFPVTENTIVSKKSPFLEYEFKISEEGMYSVTFQMLPANPFTFGENIFISYSVNDDSLKAVERVKVLPDDYKSGISEEWGDGVLNHIRNVCVQASLKKGINKIRYYADSRENVLEKIIISKYIPETGAVKKIYG